MRYADQHLSADELESLGKGEGLSGGRGEDLGAAREHVQSCPSCRRRLEVYPNTGAKLEQLRTPKGTPKGPDCPSVGVWLNLAGGLLSSAEQERYTTHAATCDHCGPVLREIVHDFEEPVTEEERAALAELKDSGSIPQRISATRVVPPKPLPHPRRWFGLPGWQVATAAAVVLAAVSFSLYKVGVFNKEDSVASVTQLLAQAYTEQRTIEPRIAGANYAPMHVKRGPGESNLNKPPALLRAEAVISDNLRRNSDDPMWLQAKARADLLDGNYEAAVRSLQHAREARPDSPELLIDLGTAYFQRGTSSDSLSDYGNANDLLGRALAKSPDNPVALFNRAIVSERIYLYTQAAEDWEHYLRVDSTGEWSDEARRRLTALREKLKIHSETMAKPLLTPTEIRDAAGRQADLGRTLDQQVEEYLRLAMTSWLPKGYYPPDGATTEAEYHDALVVLAQMTRQLHRDPWLTDLLSSTASRVFRAAVANLSNAFASNETGNNIAARQYAVVADQLFSSIGNDAGSLRARLEYLFASHDAQEGRPCLQASRALEDRLKAHHYRWLNIQFHIEKGTCYWLVGNLGKAQQLYTEAAREAERSGYGQVYLRAQDHLAGVSAATGNSRASWRIAQNGLALFWANCYPPMRGYNFYYNLYELARFSKQPYLQMSVWRDALKLSEFFNDNVIRAMAHSAMANAAIAANQPEIAEQEFAIADRLFIASPQIKSTQINQIEAETRLANAEAADGRPSQAITRLRQLEPVVSRLSDNFLAALFYTTLGDAESRAGNSSEAESALSSAINLSELELHSLQDDRSRIEWALQSSNAYRDLVMERLRHDDVRTALEIWEWYRGAPLRASTTLQVADRSGLPQSGGLQLDQLHFVSDQSIHFTRETAISYAILPQGLAIWIYDDRGIFGEWLPEDVAGIQARIRRFRDLCSDPNSDEAELYQSARGLYSLLIAPVERHLIWDRTLVIEGDGELAEIPFDALLYLGNQSVKNTPSIVSSLGVYYLFGLRTSNPISSEAPTLIAAVPKSNIPIAWEINELPDAISEGEMVARSFHSPRLLPGDEATVSNIRSYIVGKTVFHFVGHSFAAIGRAGLLASDGLIQAETLDAPRLSQIQLAVFSACDTQDGPINGVYDAEGLVGSFLRVGVPHVIASRWNVDSSATSHFMSLFYRALLSGSSVTESIQYARSELRSNKNSAHPYYWSAFTSFGAL